MRLAVDLVTAGRPGDWRPLRRTATVDPLSARPGFAAALGEVTARSRQLPPESAQCPAACAHRSSLIRRVRTIRTEARWPAYSSVALSAGRRPPRRRPAAAASAARPRCPRAPPPPSGRGADRPATQRRVHRPGPPGRPGPPPGRLWVRLPHPNPGRVLLPAQPPGRPRPAATRAGSRLPGLHPVPGEDLGPELVDLRRGRACGRSNPDSTATRPAWRRERRVQVRLPGRRVPAWSFQLRTYLPTGPASRGLGTGHVSRGAGRPRVRLG